MFLSVPQVAVWLPNGMVQMPNGTVHMPDGSVQLMDGRLMHPDGAIVKPRPDGSFDLKDGTTLLPVRPPPPCRNEAGCLFPRHRSQPTARSVRGFLGLRGQGRGVCQRFFVVRREGAGPNQMDVRTRGAWGGVCVEHCPAPSQNGVIRLADGLLKYPNQAVAC